MLPSMQNALSTIKSNIKRRNHKSEVRSVNNGLFENFDPENTHNFIFDHENPARLEPDSVYRNDEVNRFLGHRYVLPDPLLERSADPTQEAN